MDHGKYDTIITSTLLFQKTKIIKMVKIVHTFVLLVDRLTVIHDSLSKYEAPHGPQGMKCKLVIERLRASNVERRYY